MRWTVLPLIAAVILGWSGFLDRLDATTVASAELARASEEAPRATGAAAEEVESLPDIAHLTTRQADAFDILGDALQLSGQRVIKLNDSLGGQAAGIGDIVTGTKQIERVLGCVGRRLEHLLGAARAVPHEVDEIARIIRKVESIQRKSIRHMKSINRKLTALGVAAEASRVKPPPRPDIPSIQLPEQDATSVTC